MLSFIIPAHNEELWIAKCLGCIRSAMEPVAEPYEVIVVDDASTDSTPEIAEQMGARRVVRGFPDPAQASTAGLQSLRVLRVDHRKISAVRNAGAREATGDVFFFVDADTEANEQAVRAALAAVRAGAAGGGCAPHFEGPIQWWARIVIWFAVKVARLVRLVGGCYQFCTRDAFSAIGGLDETFYAGEDMAFCQAIKKVGRFVVPGPIVVTSARKLKVVTPWEVIALLVTIAIRGPRYESKWIFDILYGPRAQACRKPTEPA